jgi:hypothetical protein
VKPGGVLFAHSYKRSLLYMMHFKYKYRWLTKRLPHRFVLRFVERFGPILHRVNNCLQSRNILLRGLAFNFVPFEWIPKYGTLDNDGLLELEKLATFDGLTPTYDRPMTTRTFVKTIESEGFRIEHLRDPKLSPLYATAVRCS